MTSERLSFDFVELAPPASGLLRRVLQAFANWRIATQQRAALASFDARMLRDIGLSESDVWREMHVPRASRCAS
jgi:uncharacterized protein YjiS (DUF1127 family)